MRIDSINLSWFRGAAASVTLDCQLKSLVVYGQNAAGKSSFVDAVEYAVSNGKIDHLAHEYSGTKQERAVPNTHTPQDANTGFTATFKDGEECRVAIARNGTHTRTGAVDMASWDYRRTVLRQDEISRFIHSSKGSKYSDLLPLLGLGELEIAAENLRQLCKSVEQHSKLKEKRGAAGEISRKRKQAFGNASDHDIVSKVGTLHKKYCPASTTAGALDQCNEIAAALKTRIEDLSDEKLRYLALRGIAEAKIAPAIKAVREANGKLAGSVEPFVTEKLQVLEAAHGYGAKLKDEERIACPACGQDIGKDDFKAHVKAEQERLKEIDAVFKTRRISLGALAAVLATLQTAIAKEELEDWAAALKAGPLKDDAVWLEELNMDALRQSADEGDLVAIEQHCPPIMAEAEQAGQNAPPEVKELSDDRTLAEAAKAALEAKPLTDEIEKTDRLIAFISSTEDNVRREIREKSKAAITDISGDIGDMWKILHPGEPIDNVHLYLPDGDKAIDIALKFYGKDQDSPRLTLSESYRNSLGLCIFLALAKRESDSDRPLILDDVVVSFDRNHRGMIVELLQAQFAGRQVIIFTHDRDWFAELRQQLDASEWNFRSLRPFETPQIGIQWSDKASTFDDARIHLKDRPDSAGNDARKIMDVELALIAEKLQLRLPYMRGDKNDHRMCHDFLERLISDGKTCLQKKSGNDYAVFTEALDILSAADKLLISWGNKASHTQNVMRNEATKLIDACEKALEVFKCTSCGKCILDKAT